jgi:hypothetical protein
MKKLHPKLAKGRYEQNEDGLLVYSSGSTGEGEPESTPDSDEPIDPRWQILKNLRDN